MVGIKAIITQQGAECDNRYLSQSGRLLLFYANRKSLLLSLPSYLSTTGYRLFHSRPSQPICPLLTCVSQSAQFLHSLSSRTVSSYSFRSLPNRVVSRYSSITLLTWMTGFFEITAPTESLSAGHGRHQSNHHPGTEEDSDLFRIHQVGSYFFYANGKFLL